MRRSVARKHQIILILCVKKYCLFIIPHKHRSALIKFRCGVAPSRIETGRNENVKENERMCPFCVCVEYEIYVHVYWFIVICMLTLDNLYLIKLCLLTHSLLLTIMISCLLFFQMCQ